MTALDQFLEEYNNLVLVDEPTSHFSLIHLGTDDVWRTFKAPVEEETINAAISDVTRELATGNQILKLQAYGASGGIRGTFSIKVEGRSSAARTSGNEQISHAKAVRMNIETADMQLANMQSRLEIANQAAKEAEDRATSCVKDVWGMADMVNRMLNEKEAANLDREEREARMKNMAAMVETLTPILGQAIVIGSKYIETKVKIWEMQWAENLEKQQKAAREKQSESKEESPKEET